MGNNMADFYAQKQLLKFDKAGKVQAALHLDTLRYREEGIPQQTCKRKIH